jgi:hypothetical protein
MKTHQSRETLKAIFEDKSPLDMKLIPVPDQETLKSYLQREKEKFMTIERVRGNNQTRDLSR